jgi:hypothetical protein
MLEKRIQHGTVVAMAPGRLYLTPSPGPCTGEASCSHNCGSCGGKGAPAKLCIPTDHPENYPPGTRVTVTTRTPGQAVGALIVFGIPLLLACAALFIRYQINPSTIESAASLATVGGSFAAGFIIVGVLDRLLRRRYPVSIVPEAQPASSPDSGKAAAHG